MPPLRLRVYNVRFGDATLVSVPDRDAGGPKTRHILVDFGNSLMKEGGRDDVFEPIVDDILVELDGEPLDIFVMSHEHLDHIQGPLGASVLDPPRELKATHVWLPGSAHPDYYDTHPDAKKKKLQAIDLYEQIAAFIGADSGSPIINTMMLNNNPRATADCVDFIRVMKTAGEPTYIHREMDLDGHHDFRDVDFRIWAPEEDTSIYYGHFQRMVLGMAGSSEGTGSAEDELTPPGGIDAGAFYDLVRQRRTGLIENLFAIDKANNNSSVVFSLTWKGWTLLFTGDAEERSWKEMNKRDVLAPVHFLKVSHHGSHNGTPDEELLEKVLPLQPDDGRPRVASVSTAHNQYNGIPHDPTLAAISSRAEVRRSTEVDAGDHFDLEFPDPDDND
jgi:beta-lactamase superfamily II metal-dependent hydrolase